MSGLHAALREWSSRRGEPEWLCLRRLAALEEAAASGAELPDAPGAERAAPAPALPPELRAQGVTLRPLQNAVAEEPRRLERLLGALGSGRVDPAGAFNAAFWSGGLFVRVPAGVRGAVPLHLGADAARAAHERLVIVIEERASLDLVEGCTAAGAAASRRSSVLEAFVGEGATLRAASVQAWPPAVSYRSAKLLRAEAGARVEWLDANLGARQAAKRLRLELAGAGASGELMLCGLAGPGQDQRLEAFAVCAAGTSLAISALKARRGDGRIVFGAQAVLDDPSSAAAQSDRELDLDALDEGQLFYLGTRGLTPARAQAAALHAFFEPFARRLPLEFAVEFSRLVDAELAILD